VARQTRRRTCGNLLIAVHTESADEQKRAEQIYKSAKADDICATNEASVPSSAHA